MKIHRKKPSRIYHSQRQPINTLVFEDLSTLGFEMASRETGLNLAHSRLVMRKLGQWHAVSMVLADKQPELMQYFHSGLLGKPALEQDDCLLVRYFGGSVAALIGLVSQWPGFEHILKKLLHYQQNLRKELIRAQSPIPGELRVLNHGDLWVNNILFKYDGVDEPKQTPSDLIFVDFQMSVWGSPGYDLNYFFYTSLDLEVLQTQRENLIKEYHASLRETLQKLFYTRIPTLAQIQQEVLRREAYGFFGLYGIFPAISMDKEQCHDNNLDNYADEEFARKKLQMMFSSKRLHAALRYCLPRFDQIGIWNE